MLATVCTSTEVNNISGTKYAIGFSDGLPGPVHGAIVPIVAPGGVYVIICGHRPERKGQGHKQQAAFTNKAGRAGSGVSEVAIEYHDELMC